MEEKSNDGSLAGWQLERSLGHLDGTRCFVVEGHDRDCRQNVEAKGVVVDVAKHGIFIKLGVDDLRDDAKASQSHLRKIGSSRIMAMEFVGSLDAIVDIDNGGTRRLGIEARVLDIVREDGQLLERIREWEECQSDAGRHRRTAPMDMGPKLESLSLARAFSSKFPGIKGVSSIQRFT